MRVGPSFTIIGLMASAASFVGFEAVENGVPQIANKKFTYFVLIVIGFNVGL